MTNAERQEAAEDSLYQLACDKISTEKGTYVRNVHKICLAHGFKIDLRRWLNNEIEALDIETGKYVFLEV
tara:strand:+ start:397 stop:606 length:210 start_codon:yes stop_codon:yes gene_type:complete